MKALTFILFLGISVSVHTQSAMPTDLQELNRVVLSSYKEGKLNDALKFAQQAVDLTAKTFGQNHVETATAYSNLGIIQGDKSKTKEAVGSLTTAATIFENLSLWRKAISTYERIGLTQLRANEIDDSVLSYLRAVEVAQARFGTEAKDSFIPVLNLANVYARADKFDKADEYYLRSLSIAVRNFGKDSKELVQIQDARACMIFPPEYKKEAREAFSNAKKKILGEDKDQSQIVNGKALSLPRPAYPPEARAERLAGVVAVRVQIDEEGKVTSAKGVCGHPILRRTSEESARRARFSSTLIDGKHVQVSGIITYRFVP